MKKALFGIMVFCCCVSKQAAAQIDLNNLNINDILGKVMNVKKGFAPKFSLGNISITKIHKVAEILGMKKNSDVNRLFNTFNTGRTVYKIASFAGSAVAVYGVVKNISKTANSTSGGQTAIASGLISIGSGLIVKFLTKAASYKAVDIFNGVAVKTIKDIFSIKPASGTMGIGFYVKLD
ncbi:MAG: hypothetical protein ABIO55_08530 [Ginsengibacter sp.]